MTLTLMQDHHGSAKAKIQCLIISTNKQATSITLARTVGHFYVTLTLKCLFGMATLFAHSYSINCVWLYIDKITLKNAFCDFRVNKLSPYVIKDTKTFLSLSVSF